MPTEICSCREVFPDHCLFLFSDEPSVVSKVSAYPLSYKVYQDNMDQQHRKYEHSEQQKQNCQQLIRISIDTSATCLRLGMKINLRQEPSSLSCPCDYSYSYFLTKLL